jgi:carboxypeptidase family protein
MWRANVATIACLTSLPALLGAQIVRGRVTESGSGSAVGGVLVSLIDPRTRAQSVSTLSDPQGLYALRAPVAGTYQVEAKRIGVRRFVSRSIELASGETQVLNIAVEGLAYRLPETVVMGVAACTGATADAPRIGALWDEARTALAATRISLRERLFRGTISRYVRELDPRTRRVLKEEGRQIQGVMDKPFRAVDPDSLSIRGYVTTDGRDKTYFAPDADVLLSDAFVSDHCFRLSPPSRQRRGMMGLAFAPTPGRRMPEIEGTMWLDGRTFELRLVEFKFVNTGDLPDDAVANGEVHFEKLTNGAWVVRRWFLRLPYGGRASTPVTVSGSTPNVFVRRVGYTLREEGGNVTTETMLDHTQRSALVGTVTDSLGSPLGGAVVQLSGTPYKTIADARGVYRLEGVLPGTFNVIVEHPAYRAFGVFAADAEVTLPEGLVSQLQLSAPRTRELRTRLCPSHSQAFDSADVRINLVDKAGRPVTFQMLRLTWSKVMDLNATHIRSQVNYADSETDQHGGATFCSVPSQVVLPILLLDADRKRTVRADSVRLRDRELIAITVRAP